MKTYLIAIGEMLLLFVAAVAGFLMHPFNAEKVLSVSTSGVRSMVYDWMIVAGLMYLVLLTVEFGVRRTKSAWMRPTLCLFVVIALGLWAHLGLKTT